MDRVDFSQNDALDVIVRFHDVGRTSELRRCLLSLVCQTYRPITVNLCTQRFTSGEIIAVEDKAAPLLRIDNEVQMRIVNFVSDGHPDARSSLLNMGIRNSSGRYLAFLDYDDVIYPQSYRMLIDELRSSRAAIAFGRISVKDVDVYEDFTITVGKSSPFSGANQLDLFRANFCPIHSFVIDRSGFSPDELYVDRTLGKAEDYDLLLRICALHSASFRLLKYIVGDYYYKSDGSNTILRPANHMDRNRQAWEAAELFLEARRNVTIVSSEVQRSLGIANPDSKMTIRALLDRVDAGRLAQ